MYVDWIGGIILGGLGITIGALVIYGLVQHMLQGLAIYRSEEYRVYIEIGEMPPKKPVYPPIRYFKLNPLSLKKTLRGKPAKVQGLFIFIQNLLILLAIFLFALALFSLKNNSSFEIPMALAVFLLVTSTILDTIRARKIKLD